MRHKRLVLRSNVVRVLASAELERAKGGLKDTYGAMCPQSAFPPCATVAAPCSQGPYTCTLFTQNTCNAPCTNGTCDRCQYPF